MIRENANRYLMKEALADHPPSGTDYHQDGNPVMSLGVFEHWDSDENRKYSRNLDPENTTGIELMYIKEDLLKFE